MESGDDLNVQYPGERGELEPFISAQNAKYVGLLMAYEFRRSNARMLAVNYGTAHAVATPVSSLSVQELSIYYNNILDLAKRDKESEELYEAMSVKQIEVDSLVARFRRDDLDKEESRVLLIKIDRSLVQMERMADSMEKLSDA